MRLFQQAAAPVAEVGVTTAQAAAAAVPAVQGAVIKNYKKITFGGDGGLFYYSPTTKLVC